MKKKLIVTLCLALCIALSAFVVTASADTNNFDGETNLATTADLWNESWFTDHYGFATLDQNGILFDKYGTDTAVAAVSLKQGLPYSGKVSITFNSETTVGGGFLKVVFADASGNPNGGALKPWEIVNKAEHLAVEIQANSVALWQYNIDNEFADDGSHANGIGVQNATANYIDGKDHVLTIEYATSATAYDLKLTVDETVHYDGEIATTNLYCENVLTIGGYANSTVEDNLLIKSVKVLKTNESSAPAPVIDEDNLLGTADAWTVLENEAVVYDATTATATVTGCAEEKALVLKNALPSEGKVTVKVQYNLPEGDATHNPVGKIIILDNGDKNVLLSLDDDGNIWLHYNNVAEAKTINSVGDWAPNLLNGKNDVVITITPELTDGNSDVYVSVTAGGKTIGLAVDDLGLVSGNNLVLTGGKVGSVTYSSVKVEDFVVEMPETALVEENLLADAKNWALTGMSIADGKMPIAGPGYATTTKAIPVDSTIEFTFNATDDASAWYYLDIDTAARAGMWDAVAEGAARFRITASGSQEAFFTVDLNGASITTVSPALTDLCDGNDHTFRFVTETVEDGVKVTLYRNDVEEFSTVYAGDTAVGSAKGFYLSFGATGAHTADPVLTNVKCSYVGNVDVTAYNEAIATKRAIYALNANVTEENVTEVKAAAEALIAKLSGYTAEQLEVANNKLYAQYVVGKAEAVLVVMADKAVAAEYDETLNALDAFATITAENVEAAKTAVANAKTAYEALTDAQKAFVQNYGKVETVEIAIDEYELSLPGDSGEESTQPSESTEEPAPSNGCLASAGVASVLAIAVIAMGAVALKKKED